MRQTGLLIVLLGLALVLGGAHPCMAGDGVLPSPSLQREDGPDGALMMTDLLIIRPVGVVACAVGVVGRILAFPFTPKGDSRVDKRLIQEPFAYTFSRPLGEFDTR